MEHYDYQFCQKIVVFSPDFRKVLIARRVGEQEYNNTFSFIGGKLEHTDKTLLDGLKREKDEEVGPNFKISINPLWSYNIYYVKKDGKHMVLPHYFAIYDGGDIELSDEYSEYAWAEIDQWDIYKPLTVNIPQVVDSMLAMRGRLESGLVAI